MQDVQQVKSLLEVELDGFVLKETNDKERFFFYNKENKTIENPDRLLLYLYKIYFIKKGLMNDNTKINVSFVHTLNCDPKVSIIYVKQVCLEKSFQKTIGGLKRVC